MALSLQYMPSLTSEKDHWPVIPQKVVKSYLGELGMGPVTGFAPIWKTAIKPLLIGHCTCGVGMLLRVGRWLTIEELKSLAREVEKG